MGFLIFGSALLLVITGGFLSTTFQLLQAP
jgi:hypothetical protein